MAGWLGSMIFKEISVLRPDSLEELFCFVDSNKEPIHDYSWRVFYTLKTYLHISVKRH